jgi:hypothetical protein
MSHGRENMQTLWQHLLCKRVIRPRKWPSLQRFILKVHKNSG